MNRWTGWLVIVALGLTGAVGASLAQTQYESERMTVLEAQLEGLKRERNVAGAAANEAATQARAVVLATSQALFSASSTSPLEAPTVARHASLQWEGGGALSAGGWYLTRHAALAPLIARLRDGSLDPRLLCAPCVRKLMLPPLEALAGRLKVDLFSGGTSGEEKARDELKVRYSALVSGALLLEQRASAIEENIRHRENYVLGRLEIYRSIHSPGPGTATRPIGLLGVGTVSE